MRGEKIKYEEEMKNSKEEINKLEGRVTELERRIQILVEEDYGGKITILSNDT